MPKPLSDVQNICRNCVSYAWIELIYYVKIPCLSHARVESMGICTSKSTELEVEENKQSERCAAVENGYVIFYQLLLRFHSSNNNNNNFKSSVSLYNLINI